MLANANARSQNNDALCTCTYMKYVRDARACVLCLVCLLVCVCVYVRLMFAQNQRQRRSSSLSSSLVRASSHMCGEVYLESCPCHKEAQARARTLRAQQTTMRTRTQRSHHVARQCSWWWLGGLVACSSSQRAVVASR